MEKNILNKFYEHCQQHEHTHAPISVPDIWTQFDTSKLTATYLANGEVLVDPYHFFKVLSEQLYLNKNPKAIESLSQSKGLKKDGAWLNDAIIYSSLIRTSSAWDHDRSGRLEDENLHGLKDTGTFVKMLALLPHLKKMGVNTLYLLPIMRFSKYSKKGDLGSPYSVKDFFLLDEGLKDPLTHDAFTLDEEFRLMIEAAHALNIRVMIDIIPKTNAIDSNFIKDHPEWFYWIKCDEKPHYVPPKVPGVPNTAIPTAAYIKPIYESKHTLAHINRFTHNPKQLDAALFNKLKKRKNPLQAIEKNMGITIAPAFSDHINDPQPPWTDVTFFRMYFDHPEHAKPYLKDNTPPYILFDTIKSNLYPGKQPNQKLWDMITDIIPYFQRTFGIDGARIDMGHALPKPLLQAIIKKAKAVDPDVGFIAEELNNDNAQTAKDNGYNIIVGNGFIDQPRVFDGSAKRFFTQAKDYPLALFAGAETHDTPRIAARDGKETLAKTLAVLNYFMPNGVPFINAGMELYETQAMNLGLDATEVEQKRLDYHDPYYNKLALFDRYQLHYLYEKRYELPTILKRIAPLRKQYLGAIKNKNRTFILASDNPFFIGIVYHFRNKLLLVLGNLNPFHDEWITPSIKTIQTKTGISRQQGTLLFSTNEEKRAFTQFKDPNTLDIHLAKGEVKIVEL